MRTLAVLGAFVGSTGSRILIAALVALAVAGVVVTLAVVFGQRQARVERRLAGYEVPEYVRTPVAPRDAAEPETRVVQQAVEVTGRLAERAGILARTELLLEQADLPLRPAEVLFYVPALAVLVALVVVLVLGPLAALLALLVLLAGPYVVLYERAQRRRKKFEAQLPDTLTLLAGSMRAGFSFMQGIEAVAQETSNPMRRELQQVFNESRLGRPVEDALDDVAERMQSRDLAWAVMALRIQREVGGNLAELLDTVADTMTKRERLRAEIRSLTAEGRLSGIVLSIFPPIFAVMLLVIAPDYVKQLVHETAGVIGLIAAVVLTVVGWVWIKQVVDIEV